jgi:hypothetical protein
MARRLSADRIASFGGPGPVGNVHVLRPSAGAAERVETLIPYNVLTDQLAEGPESKGRLRTMLCAGPFGYAAAHVADRPKRIAADAASTRFSGITTSDDQDSAPANQEGLTKLGFAVLVAVIGTLSSSAVVSLTRLQPVAVVAAVAGVALLVVANRWLQQTTMAPQAIGRATIGFGFAYSFLWLAAYLLVRSL